MLERRGFVLSEVEDGAPHEYVPHERFVDDDPHGAYSLPRLIGVNHTSIYSVFFMCLCNLNARFTPVFLKITLIPNSLMFCRY